MTITKDGVTQDITALPDGTDVCTEIDIEDGVKTLVLGGTGQAPVRYRLRNMMKCFPDVKELVINANVIEIDVSNFTLPNVRRVFSHSNNFLTGVCLLRTNGFRPVLLNTFCRQEDEHVDISDAVKIGARSMEGCRSRNIRFPCGSVKTEASAFSGMEYSIRPFTDGVSCAWNRIVMLDTDAEEVVLPPEATAYLQEDTAYSLKKVVISSELQSRLLYPLLKSADTVVIDGDCDLQWFQRQKDIQNLEVRNNPSYCSVDGVLYTKDRTRLVCFPGGRKGEFTVPEGTAVIEDNAFNSSVLTSVKLPDSLVFIGSSAFYNSKIEYVDFGNGLREIGTCAFSFSKLMEADIPSSVTAIRDYAFQNCEQLKEVKLHNGLLRIGSSVFSCCESLSSITLPATLYSVSEGSLHGIDDIFLTSDEIPFMFFNAVFDSFEDTKKSAKFFRVHYGDKTITFPYCMGRKCENALFHVKFADKLFTQEIEDGIPEMIDDLGTRQDTMIRMMETFSQKKQEELKAYLRKCGRKIIIRLITEQKEQLLTRFVGMNILSKSTIAGCAGYVPDKMVQAKAAFLDAVSGGKKRKSFGL